MRVEMLVSGLTIDPVNNAPIVILREKEGQRIVPIWIGAVEASAIAFELEGIKMARPMTHDLLKEIVARLGGRVDRVAVTELKDNTYFAMITIQTEVETLEVDARPSDAVALALRVGAPLYCEEAVIQQAQATSEERQRFDVAEGDGPEGEEPEGDGPEDQEGPVEEGARQTSSMAEENEGPTPLVDAEGEAAEGLLERLDPRAFGKYKM